jgi:hypothetical protein
MNILKLYHARWKQDVFDEHGNQFKNRVVEYFVQYERVNHIVHQHVEVNNGYRTVTGHIDDIDTHLFNEINTSLMQIPNIKEFDSGVYEFRPWLDYEQIERAWASKRALGYPFNDLVVNTQTNRIVALATRLRFLDAQSVKNSVIYNIPQAINLDIQGQIPTLIRADFYTPAETDRIIQEYWADREGGII